MHVTGHCAGKSHLKRREREGIHAVMVTDTAIYRHPCYHTPIDTPDKLRYPEMARVVGGLAMSIAALARTAGAAGGR